MTITRHFEGSTPYVANKVKTVAKTLSKKGTVQSF